MAGIPSDLDCRWSYYLCDSEDEPDEDWYRVDNVEYDALDDILENDYVYVWDA